MIKYITAALILLTITTSQAQNNRADTTILGIYNTGMRFTVTRADFGTQTATELIFDMVLAFDTVKVITSVADTTRGGRKQKHSYEHRCNYLSGVQGNAELFKDKIVLMELNKDCDVIQVCLLAQRSGAKAFMFIHNSNSNGNIHLPKQGLYKDSIRIPVFCVGKEKGADISALLPSVAGIKTKAPPPSSLSRVTNDSTKTNVLLTKQAVGTEGLTTQNEQTINNTELLNDNGSGKQGFSVSPNPTRNQANISYQFLQATDVTVEVKAASGQVIFSRLLRGATVGSLDIPTVDYPNGTYFVSMQYGKAVKTTKLVVRH